MAKVKAPLFGLGASGQLGKSLVYFNWKGLDVVREYVEPANPNTAAQQTQRGRMGDAVDSWHVVAELVAADKLAWSLAASIRPTPRSGFNEFCKEHIDIAVSGETSNMGWDGALTDDADGTFSATVEEDGASDGVNLLWGVSKTALINVEACAEGVNIWTVSPVTNVAGMRVYGRFVILTGAAVVGRTGIFQLDVA